jgi:hypothetical protein
VGTGGARRGRRDNGLVAAEYAAAGDVDPRIGEHLLDVLGAGGIAAYLQPSADLNPITRTTTVPARPTDRLFVDRAYVETARGYLAELAENPPGPAPIAEPARHEPGPEPSDVEAQWARIVAQFHAEAEAEAHPWPDAKALESGRGHRDDPPRVTARGADEPSLLDGLDTFGRDLPDDEDEGTYTPPPPPPLPRPSGAVILAVIGIVGGFVVFLRPRLLPLDTGLVQLVSFLAVLAGVATLILRMRPGGDDEDSDPDDGAVV